MTTTPEASRRLPHVDRLRGLAAVTVMAYHVTGTNMLMAERPAFVDTLSYFVPPRSAVLLFFALSGFIIGRCYPILPDAHANFDFIYRRWVRLAPIYWLVMLATGILAVSFGLAGSARDWFSNLTFAGNFEGYASVAAPLWSINQAAWSLNCEWIAYLLYAFALVHVPTRQLPLVAITLALATLPLLSWLPVAHGYACGVVFWMAGLFCSRLPQTSAPPARAITRGLLLAAAAEQIAPVHLLLQHLGGKEHASAAFVNLASLELLPAVLLIIAASTGRDGVWHLPVLISAWLLPLLGLTAAVWTGHSLWETRWLISLLLLAGAVVAPPLLTPLLRLRGWTWLGERSYALYLVHCPLAFVVSLAPAVGPAALAYAARLTVWATASVAAAFWLEGAFSRQVRPCFLALRHALSPRKSLVLS